MDFYPTTDEEWGFLEALVHEKRTARGRPPRQHRKIIDGVFWMAINVTPWRNLPEEFGKWNTIYRQFTRWSENGLWDNILKKLDEMQASGDNRLDKETFDALYRRIVATRALSQRTRTAGRPSRQTTSRGTGMLMSPHSELGC